MRENGMSRGSPSPSLGESLMVDISVVKGTGWTGSCTLRAHARYSYPNKT